MYSAFLTSLFEQGRAHVGPLSPLDDDEISAAGQTLARYEAIDRQNIPGESPAFVPVAAAWAGAQFYRACQLVVYRNYGEDEVRGALDIPLPGERGAAEHYSVDLVFRFLPDLFRLAATAAEDDPLLEFLRAWARDWPLSSVGLGERIQLPANAPLDVTPIIENPALRIVYADRVLATGDASRLNDPRVAEQVRVHLGVHPALAASLSPSLRKLLLLDEHLETGAA